MTLRAEYGARSPRLAGLLICVAFASLSACSTSSTRPDLRTPPLGGSAPVQPMAAAQDDSDQRFQSALALMKSQQPDAAQAAFQALAKDYPEMSGALTNLGILYAQSSDRTAAVNSFYRAVSANPQNAVALNWMGVLYRESGAYERAEQAYRQALTVRPDYAAAQLNLGILYDVYLRRPQDALTAYRNYRALGGKELIVAAWIREIESKVGTQTAARDGALP